MPNKPVHFPKLARRRVYSRQRSYKGYRQEIRVDCQGRCVYCDAHENELGGQDGMSLDHFRPKDLYKLLINDPLNLVWCCTTCNRWKDNDWPAHGTPGTVSGTDGFIDPFMEDRNGFFEVREDGGLSALRDPAAYMISLLLLNRAGLRVIRRRRETAYNSQSRLISFLDAAIKRLNLLLDDTQNLDPETFNSLREERKCLEDARADAQELASLDFSLY